MIWVKTDAGRAEVQRRAQLNDRHLRALLVLVDGKQTEAALLARLPGSSPEDLVRLRELGLIVPLHSGAPTSAHASRQDGPTGNAPGINNDEFAELAGRLKRIIAAHLGLGGLALTLSLENATTVDELAQVAHRTVEQISGRYGPKAAEAAKQALPGLLLD